MKRKEKKRMKAKIPIAIIGVALLVLLVIAIPSALAVDTVTVTAPAAAAYWGGTKTITWTNVSSNYSEVTYYVQYSATGAAPWTYCANGGGLSNTTSSLSWATAGLTDSAAYKINVTRVNATTNVSGNSGTFTVDNTAPVVAITGSSAGLGTDDHIYTLASTLDFSGTCSDATAGVANVTIGGTSGTVSGSTWTASSVSVSTDCNVVTATIYDNSANSATDTCTVCRSVTKTGSSYVPPTVGEAVAPSITERLKAIKPLSILPGGDKITQKLSGLKGISVIALILLALIVVLLREKKK